MPYVSYDEFISRLKFIKKFGYVKSLRAGNTGIGKTLEELLNIEENNRNDVDIADLELKSHRASSNSLITISTKEPHKANREVWNDALAHKYGYENSSGKTSARTTLKLDRYSEKTGLYLSLEDFDEGKIRICHEEDGLIATYMPHEVEKWVQKARKGLVLVEADVIDNTDTEYFWYKSATRYYDWDRRAFKRLVRSGKVRVDIRIREGKNNGTAIRVRGPSVLNELYKNSENLLSDVAISPPSTVEPPYEMPWGTVEDVDDLKGISDNQSTLDEYSL